MKHRELKGLPVDQRGHRFLGPRFEGEPRLDALVTVIDEDKPLHDGFVSVHDAFSCDLCDAHPGFDLVEHTDASDGVGLRAKTECLLPNGIEIVSHLSVSSGAIVIADDLRPVYPSDVPNIPGYNSKAGQHWFAHDMAHRYNVVTGPTTNTSLSLVRLNKRPYGATDGDLFALVTFDTEAEPDDDDYIDFGPDAEILAEVDCNVWSYAIADYGEWKARLAALGLDEDSEDLRGYTVVEVPNGTYEFVHHTTRGDRDAHDEPWPIIWARMRRCHPMTLREEDRFDPLTSETLAVAEFMLPAGQTIRAIPTADIPEAERLLRARLVLSEALELVAALGVTVTTPGHDLVEGDDLSYDITPGSKVDVAEALDALVDIHVVTKGTALTLGLPVDEAFGIVHETNMAKIDRQNARPYVVDAGGKVGKPDGWQPPTERLVRLLRERGWSPSEE